MHVYFFVVDFRRGISKQDEGIYLFYHSSLKTVTQGIRMKPKAGGFNSSSRLTSEVIV